MTILCLIILTVPAYARFDNISDLQRPWSQVAEENKRAIIKLTTTSGRCTGTVISNKGHVLTAAHCFQECLKRQDLYKLINISVDERKSKYWVVEVTHDRPVHCSMRYKSLANDFDDFVYENVELQAISAGRVLLNYSDEGIDDLIDFEKATGKLEELRDKSIGRIFGDYLVLSTREAPQACVRTASLPPPSNSTLMSLSYPDVTYSRKLGVNTNGRDLYASVGRKNINGILDSNSPYIDKISAQHGRADLNRVYNANSIIWSDIDSRKGSSGAPVFNHDSELSSIVIYNACPAFHSAHEGCRYSTASLSIQSIQTAIADRYGTFLAQEVFSCPHSSVLDIARQDSFVNRRGDLSLRN